jgi:hypothetical protein
MSSRDAPSPKRRWISLVGVFWLPLAAATAAAVRTTSILEFIGWGVLSAILFFGVHRWVLSRVERWAAWCGTVLAAWSAVLFAAGGIGAWKHDRLEAGLKDLKLPVSDAQALLIPAVVALTVALALLLFFPGKSGSAAKKG